MDTLVGYRCDAVLMLGPDMADACLNQLGASLPVVLVGRRVVHRTEVLETVRTDEDAGLRLAVEHLVGLGHRRIAHVDGGRGTKASDRRRGYRVSMSRAGLKENVDIVGGGETGELGRRAGVELATRSPRPTAIIAYNDDAAWGVMRAIADQGLAVPRDISVVGYDGSQLSRMAPRELTTIRQDADSIGRISVERAIARLEGEGLVNVDVVMMPSLVLGETTGPPPAS